MKKAILIFFILLLFIVILTIKFMDYTKLQKCSNYTVVNEKNETISSCIYKYKETDDVLILKLSLEKKPIYLKIVISEKLIGLPEYGAENYLYITEDYLFEKTKVFSPVNNSIDNLINEYQFSKDSIKFNTFWEFKEFGNEIKILKTK